VALPGPGHYEQDDGMEITCGFGIWLEKLELFWTQPEKEIWTGDVKTDAKMTKSWDGTPDQPALGPVLGEIHGCRETKSSKRGKRLSLQTLQQNVILASFEVCASAFKDGPKRTDWAPEDCFVQKQSF